MGLFPSNSAGRHCVLWWGVGRVTTGSIDGLTQFNQPNPTTHLAGVPADEAIEVLEAEVVGPEVEGARLG